MIPCIEELDSNRLYTAKEAAAYLSTSEREVSASSVKDWTRKGLLRGKRMGNLWTYREDDLAAFVLPELPEFHYKQHGKEKTW